MTNHQLFILFRQRTALKIFIRFRTLIYFYLIAYFCNIYTTFKADTCIKLTLLSHYCKKLELVIDLIRDLLEAKYG